MSTVKAVLALLIAVFALSLVPLIIKVADVENNNPFAFAMIQTMATIPVLAIYLRITAQSRFGTTKLKEIIGHGKNLFVSSYKPKYQRSSLLTALLTRPVIWIHTPLLWAVIVGLEYSLLAWSDRYIETAVSSIIYGLWPIVIIYALAYLSRDTEGARQYHIFFQKKVLTVLAFVGIVFVAYSQIEINNEQPAETNNTSQIEINSQQPVESDDSQQNEQTLLLTLSAMMIALVAGILNGMNPAMTIHFSDLLYQITPCRKSRNKTTIAQQKLWLSVCAVTVGRILSLPLNLTAGLILFKGDLGISWTALGGAVLAGVLLVPTASILLRLANLSISDLSINALCFAEPMFSFIWIMLLTRIEVPRFDLFIVGAGIIAATNILMQIVPDINLGTRPSTDRKKP